MESIPIGEAKFLPWLEPYMDQRMVPPKPGDVKKYSPDQPRDDHGRWSADGGGGAQILDRPWEAARAAAEATGRDLSRFPPDSRDLYKVDGKYVGERAILHGDIIAGIMAGGVASGAPTVTMLGGGPAAGKSTALGAGAIPVPPGAVTVNPDDIKAALPEYGQMQREDGAVAAQASTFVHEESSEVSKDALVQALPGPVGAGHGFSVVYDATGDNSLANIQGKVDGFYANGATRVDAQYVTCDVQTAIDRAYQREDETGRATPIGMLESVHQSLSATVPQAVDQRVWDSFHLWSTNGPSPVLVASYEDRGALAIHDQEEWDKFLAKANEDPGSHRYRP